MDVQTEGKKYEFYLEINSLKDHTLYLRKPGEEIFYNDTQNEDGKINDQEECKSNNNNEDTHGKEQKFEECWGFDNAADELKDFNTWKEDFFPTLLEKYNINKEDCKILVKGPQEVFDFFSEENYEPYFKLVGDPIETLANDDIEQLLLKWYANREDFKNEDIRACLKDLIKQLKKALTNNKQKMESNKIELEEIQDKKANLLKENEEKKCLINEYENEKEVMKEKIDSIFVDEKIILIGEDRNLKKVKKRDDVKSYTYEDKIKDEIKNLSVERDLKEKLNSISSDLKEKLKSLREDSVKIEKELIFLKKYSFDRESFEVKKKEIVEECKSQAKNQIDSHYNKKIKNLEEDENGNTAKINALDEKIKSKETEEENLNEDILKINNFLDEYYKLINPTKQNSEETEGNNNE